MADTALLASGPLDHAAAAARRAPDAQLALVPGGTKLVFRGREAAIAACGQAFGVALPRTACAIARNGARSALWLGPDEWLLRAPEDGSLFASLEAATGQHPHSLADVSHRSIGISLSGPKAAWVLNQHLPRDLALAAFPVDTVSRTVFAKAEIILIRTGAESFDIDVWRSFAPYVWGLLEEARAEL